MSSACTSTSTSTSNQQIQILSSISDIKKKLDKYRPLLIEGPGQADGRDATVVGKQIVQNVRNHWNNINTKNDDEQTKNIDKPILVITQGDPIKKNACSGIAHISRYVANELNATRCLVHLDPSVHPTHGTMADRYNVTYETTYTQIKDIVSNHDEMLVTNIATKVEEAYHDKNQLKLSRAAEEQNRMMESEREQAAPALPLALDYKDFALLQETVKCAMKIICGEVTVAHTVQDVDMDPCSVTSFYNVGIDLGIIVAGEDMVPYSVYS